MTATAMDRVDCVVVGAGVVGLAVARALARGGHEVVVIEQARAIGTGVSSRNSEVIHAGLYYPAGSQKAQLCVRGRELLYSYCAERGVAHRRCGKLVVATTAAEVPKLHAIATQAAANGLFGADGLLWLTSAQARALEPELHCVAALRSPATGIVDSHGLMVALLGDAERVGALLALASPWAGARREGPGWIVQTGGAEAFEMAARWVINCAGLHAQAVAAGLQGFPAKAIPPLHLAKGNYFSLAARSPFTHLIYPTPVDGGLGVHLTLVLLVFLAAGVWIAPVLMIAGWVGMVMFTGAPAGLLLATTVWAASSNWALASLPLFIWMGEILFRSRISEDMFRGLAPWASSALCCWPAGAAASAGRSSSKACLGP